MGKLHGNSRLAKIGIPVLKRKGKGGAPKGNRNAHKHGAFSAKAEADNERVRVLLQKAKALIAHMKALTQTHNADMHMAAIQRAADASVPPVTQK